MAYAIPYIVAASALAGAGASVATALKSPPKTDQPDLGNEEDARNLEAQDESKKRRRARASRVFTGPSGGPVGESSLGRGTLLGS